LTILIWIIINSLTLVVLVTISKLSKMPQVCAGLPCARKGALRATAISNLKYNR
jgi:hypothetical protein